MSRTVFISYARSDLEIAREIDSDLSLAGHDVWLDQDLRAGQDWWDEILDRVEASDVFLFAMSTAWADSLACKSELVHARQAACTLLPVVVGALPSGLGVGGELERIHRITYSVGDKQASLRLAAAVAGSPTRGAVPAGIKRPRLPTKRSASTKNPPVTPPTDVGAAVVQRSRSSATIAVSEGGMLWHINVRARAMRFKGNAVVHIGETQIQPANLEVKATGDVMQFVPVLPSGRQLHLTVRASDLGKLSWLELRSEGALLVSSGT